LTTARLAHACKMVVRYTQWLNMRFKVEMTNMVYINTDTEAHIAQLQAKSDVKCGILVEVPKTVRTLMHALSSPSDHPQGHEG